VDIASRIRLEYLLKVDVQNSADTATCSKCADNTTVMIANAFLSRTLPFISAAHPSIWLYRFVAEHAIKLAVCLFALGGGGPVMFVESVCPPYYIYCVI